MLANAVLWLQMILGVTHTHKHTQIPRLTLFNKARSYNRYGIGHWLYHMPSNQL